MLLRVWKVDAGAGVEAWQVLRVGHVFEAGAYVDAGAGVEYMAGV